MKSQISQTKQQKILNTSQKARKVAFISPKIVQTELSHFEVGTDKDSCPNIICFFHLFYCPNQYWKISPELESKILKIGRYYQPRYAKKKWLARHNVNPN